MKLIDPCHPVPVEAYQQSIGRMCEVLRRRRGLRAIFQIGHISTPGISDLDLLAVFSDDVTDPADPRSELPAEDGYLFVHGPFAVSAGDFAEARERTFFHNYKLLWGDPPTGSPVEPLLPEDRQVVQRQVALEYLVRMFVGLTVECAYGILKVRALFLQAKALLYDCDFLAVGDHPLRRAVNAIVRQRESCFTGDFAPHRLPAEARELLAALGAGLAEWMERFPLYLPGRPVVSLAPHLRMMADRRFDSRRRGWVPPAAFAFGGRRYFNLLHRWNRFEFRLPYRTEAAPAVLAEAFSLRDRLTATNRQRFPAYLPLASSLALG